MEHFSKATCSGTKPNSKTGLQKICWAVELITYVLSMQAPNEASLLFTNEYEQWEAGCNLKVFTGTRDTFLDLFDEDDTLTYEPETTAAIILTGDDEEAEKAALEVNSHLNHGLNLFVQ